MKYIREIIEARKLISVREDKLILDVVRVMVKQKIGAVPVTDDSGNVTGIFTERDLMKRVVAAELDPKKTLISQVMTKKLFIVSSDETYSFCLRKMKERKFRHLLVSEKGRIVGIVSQRDLIEIELTVKTNELLSIDA